MAERNSKLARDARQITIRGAREHNLKNIDVAIPRDSLVVFTGLSGSGKSSLAFDTIYAEGQRRYVESLVRLRAAIPRDDAEAGRRPDRRPLAGNLDRAEDHLEESALDRRHRHRDLRLHAPALGARRRALFAGHRPADRKPDRLADGRPRAGAAGRHAHLRAGAGRARPQGRIQEGTRRIPAQGLPAREDRRRLLRDRRRQAARQEVHPRHRRGGRPPGRARRHRHAARGLPRAMFETRRRPRNRRIGGLKSHRRRRKPRPQRQCRAPDLLREIRLPGLRLHHFRNRAAAVLVQQSVRCLPGMRRPRTRAAYRCGSRDPRPRRHVAQGRHRAVGEIVIALLHPDARRARQTLPLHARHQVEGPAEEDAGRDPLRLRRRRHQVRLRRRPARLHHQEAVRGRHHQSRAPLQGNRKRVGARGPAEIFHRRALQGLPGRAPQARGALRQDRRHEHRADRRHERQARRRMVHDAARTAQRQAERDRRARAQGDPRAAASSWSTSGSIISPCRARPARCPAARASASGSPRRSAPASPACFTCSTSRRSACTSATMRACSKR